MRANPEDRIARVGVRFDFSLLYRLVSFGCAGRQRQFQC
jgi:hypothetical protein